MDPDWVGIYIDGELYKSHHHYEEARIIRDAINEHDITEAESMWASFDTWNGDPQTLDELREMYEVD